MGTLTTASKLALTLCNQGDEARFAEIFGELQARETPLDRFGTKKRWARLATLHGSLDASKEKLVEVYDDWWRRWRSRHLPRTPRCSPRMLGQGGARQ